MSLADQLHLPTKIRQNTMSTTQQTLWLDPFRPLAVSEQAQLRLAGLSARPVNTLEELQNHLHQADCLVIRLNGSLELLHDVLNIMKNLGHQIPVICRVERCSLEMAVAAMRHGACHVLAADEWSSPKWQAALSRPPAPPSILNQAAAAPRRLPPPRSVVYVDPVSCHLLALAQRVAQANVTVLLEGPTGSGKEVLARVLHESSVCARGPFVGLNCAAMPEQMIEDMLFGHEKGAFTGALKEHKGLFEQAQGGTLFLDEITEMPIHLQAKLLRVLQERSLVRLGGERVIELDARVIAATNKDLREAIVQREFREDLYFRISTFKLRVPALLERPGDILPLVARLLARHAPGDRAFNVSAQAQALLLAYPWPGNVRELENVVLRAMVLCTDQLITPAHLMFDDMALSQLAAQVALTQSPALSASPLTAEPAAASLDGFITANWTSASPPSQPQEAELQAHGLQAAVKDNEHQLIMAAIKATESRTEAAKKLGISPRTLRYKMARLRGFSPALATAL